MKKVIYLLFALPLFLASCHDDNKLPDVSLDVTMSGQTDITDKGVVVIPQGTPLVIEGISIAESSVLKKDVALGGATYFWDYQLLNTNIVQPFGINIDTSSAPIGNHLLQIEIPVLAVGYSPATAYIAYKVSIVEPEETPENPDEPSTPETVTITPQMKAN